MGGITVAEYILQELENQGLSLRELMIRTGHKNEWQKIYRRFREDKLTPYDLFSYSKELNINLEEMRKKIKNK